MHRTPLRALAAFGGILTVAALLVSCAPPGAEPAAPDDPSGADTFTAGLVASTTGFAAATGIDMRRGWDLYWKLHDGRAGRYTVETVFEDDASDPETALTKAARLVDDRHVDVLVGPVLANNALAVADYATRAGVANLSQTSADDITQRDASPLVIRTGAMAGSQATFAAGQWALDQGYTTAATICPDYAFGWDQCGGFVSTFTEGGGQVAQQLWYPNTAPDLSSYTAQLADTDVDVIFAGTTGGTDAGNFLRTANDFGILSATPVITGAATTSAGPLADVGDIARGVHSVAYYAEGDDSPANREFRNAYEKEYGAIPSVYASGAYFTAQLLAAALAGAEDKPTAAALVEAVKDAQVPDSVWSDVTFDDDNGIVSPLYIRVVEPRDDGKLWNVVESRFDDVSQYWTFDRGDWLAGLPFSQTVNGQR